MRKFFFLFITIGTLLMILVMYKTGASLKTNDTPKDWTDFAKEVLKVCPPEEQVNIDKYAEEIKSTNGRVSMWWD